MAAALALRLILLVFLTGISCHARTLNLNSFDDYLISDGVDHVENQESSISRDPSIPNTCQHQYGFLPCAENAAGYIFQIFVYQGLLIFGEHQLGKGSNVILHTLGVENYGGIIFRILMALPSMMLMIVSGAFGSQENAQSQVSVGVGIYAGITVFSLTLQWGLCVIFGRTNLPGKSEEHSEAQQSNKPNCLPAREKLIKFKDTGVSIDPHTRDTAKIMLLSLIPYVIVQLVDVFNTSAGNRRIVTLIALILSFLSLIAYFVYQISNKWIQQISLDYSKYDLLRTGFLQHVQQLGQLVNENGKLNITVIKKLFADTDKDDDKCITKDELEKLVVDVIKTGKVKVGEKYAIQEIMKAFDFNNDRKITENEFIEGCQNWIEENKNNNSSSRNIFHEVMQLFKEKKEDDPKEIDRIMSKILKHAETELLKSKSLITDGKPDTENIKNLFKEFDIHGDGSISKSELEELIRNVKFGEFELTYEDIVKELFKDFDQDSNGIIDEPEFLSAMKRWLEKAIRLAKTPDRTRSIDVFDEIVWRKQVYDTRAVMRSLFQVSLGIVMLTFLGGPLMVSILQLSYAMQFPSFSISFVIVPLAMNARAAIAALFPASKKSTETASLTFSEIYNGVIMNNIAGLTTLLAIVYAKELTWDFSAEVLTILVVCAIIGILAYSCDTYPLWTCILAFVLYPFSLGMFYFVQVFLNWN